MDSGGKQKFLAQIGMLLQVFGFPTVINQKLSLFNPFLPLHD
jgi:hypothetical protein